MVCNPSILTSLMLLLLEGIYKSTDGGTTWNMSWIKRMVLDLLIDPVDAKFVVYAGVGNVDSTNAGYMGLSMADQIGPDSTMDCHRPLTGRITLALNPLNHNSVLALVADLYSLSGSTDHTIKGSSWTSINGLMEIVSYRAGMQKWLCLKMMTCTKNFAGRVDVFRSDLSGELPLSASNYFGCALGCSRYLCNTVPQIRIKPIFWQMVACIARMISVIILWLQWWLRSLHNLTSVRYPYRTVIS